MVFQERKWARRIERDAAHAARAGRASRRLVRREGAVEARPPSGPRPQHGSSPATAARALKTAFLVGAVRDVA